MKIISSQRYINEEILEEKLSELGLDNATSINIPVSYIVIGNKDYAIVRDGHHRLEAAKILDLEIKYTEYEDNNWDSSWTVNDVLENLYIDSDWYDIETGYPVF
jgi:uncharacterized protein (DUF1015 family)